MYTRRARVRVEQVGILAFQSGSMCIVTSRWPLGIVSHSLLGH